MLSSLQNKQWLVIRMKMKSYTVKITLNNFTLVHNLVIHTE